MIGRVKKAFVDNLPNLEWMDNKTRVAAVGKVSIKVTSHSFSFTDIASSVISLWAAIFS